MAEIERTRAATFSSGYHCALFGADCVMAMTGQDLAINYRGCRDLPHAWETFRAAGYEHINDLLRANFPEINPIRAAAGDIVVFPSDLIVGWAVGVVIGDRAAVRRVEGVATVPFIDAKWAFHVPFAHE
jgi:hypothetical protein